MKYTKIKAEFRDAHDRLNRTLLVRSDISLPELGCVLCTAFHAEYEHLFLFEKKGTSYVPGPFMEDPIPGYKLMDRFHLKDLGNSFRFVYDTGDDWTFDVKVYKQETMLEEDLPAVITGGAGMGIWEDNSYTLRSYLAGKIDPESDEEDEEKGYYLPWNMSIEKYGDFDHFDLEAEQEFFSEVIEQDISNYKEQMDIHGEDEKGGLWNRYHELCDEAEYAMYTGDEDSSLWTEIIEAFMDGVQKLKNSGRLPKTLEDLEEETDVDVSYLCDDLPDGMEEAEMFEESLEFLEWLLKTFDMDEYYREDVTAHQCFALHQTDNDEGALKAALAFADDFPESLAAQGMVIRCYTDLGENEKAEKIISLYIHPSTSCNEDNYPLFRAAEYYYEKAEKTDLLEKIRDEIRAEEEREEEELDDMFNDDDFMDMGWSENELLEKYSRECEENGSPATLLLVTALLGELMEKDGLLLCNAASVTEDTMDVAALADEEGNTVLPLYTSAAHAALNSKENEEVIPVDMHSLFAHVFENDMDGILINPGYDHPGTFVPVQALTFLVDLMNIDSAEVREKFLS